MPWLSPTPVKILDLCMPGLVRLCRWLFHQSLDVWSSRFQWAEQNSACLLTFIAMQTSLVLEVLLLPPLVVGSCAACALAHAQGSWRLGPETKVPCWRLWSEPKEHTQRSNRAQLQRVSQSYVNAGYPCNARRAFLFCCTKHKSTWPDKRWSFGSHAEIPASKHPDLICLIWTPALRTVHCQRPPVWQPASRREGVLALKGLSGN